VEIRTEQETRWTHEDALDRICTDTYFRAAAPDVDRAAQSADPPWVRSHSARRFATAYVWSSKRHAPDAVTAAVCRLAAQDEARNVAFGMAHLREHIAQDPDVRVKLANAVRLAMTRSRKSVVSWTHTPPPFWLLTSISQRDIKGEALG
jgi:hypothetical protein